jgi:hypothetical protein
MTGGVAIGARLYCLGCASRLGVHRHSRYIDTLKPDYSFERSPPDSERGLK